MSLDDSPSLRTIEDLLAALPDANLLDLLRRARGKWPQRRFRPCPLGRRRLPRRLRHVPAEAVLAELRRNEGLRRLIGIDSKAGVSRPWNISRFEKAWATPRFLVHVKLRTDQSFAHAFLSQAALNSLGVAYPSELCGRTVLYSRRNHLPLSLASATDSNSSRSRNSSRKRL